MKLGCLVPMYFSRKFIKCAAPILLGKFEFTSGKCQGISVSPKGMNPLIISVDNEGPDQTAQMHRLIWTFTVGICLKGCFRMSRLI